MYTALGLSCILIEPLPPMTTRPVKPLDARFFAAAARPSVNPGDDANLRVLYDRYLAARQQAVRSGK